ncbi:MAG: glycosyl hydrolase family 5, partial [Clostridia bacterium]|nr:glycosyl hydrolase family 5 [Clostridia bacterium]
MENYTSFVFTAEANKGASREAHIIVTAGDKQETLIIVQEKGDNSGSDPADEKQPAVIVARELGLGWNLGNQLDAHANNVAGETLWGNGKATQETLHKVREAGFTSVRIPVTWLGKVGAAPGYVIDSGWLERVAEVVGYTEQAGLKAIINIHHDGHRNEDEPGNWLDITKAASNAAANEAIKAQLSAMWTQIAERFKEKGEFLIFEGVNEIHDGNWGYGENTSDGGRQY